MCPASMDAFDPAQEPPQGLLDLATLRNLVDLDDGGTELLSEMIQIFREDTPRRIQNILAAAAAGNATELSQAGHALKGGAGALGASAMRQFAADLEIQGRKGSLVPDPELPQHLEHLFQTSLQALEDYAAKVRG